MKKRPTIHDVAERAGVTATTVSRVLNNHHYVSDETRAHVLEVIKEMDYRPRHSARQMRTQTTRLFGLLTDEISTSPYGYEIIRGAQEEAWAHNQVMMIINVGRDKKLIEEAVEELLEREVEGIIYASSVHSVVDLPSLLTKVPTVLANCYEEQDRFVSFIANEVKGGFDATRILLEQGHRRIAFLNLMPTDKRKASAERLMGYQKALGEHGIPFDPQLLRYTNHEPLAGYYYAREFMQFDNPPTAFFCGNDRTALECYMALKELGIKIPDDMSIVGYDDYKDISERLHPPLTTIALPQYQIGRSAMNYLYDSIHNGKNLKTIRMLIDCPPVIRDSVHQ